MGDMADDEIASMGCVWDEEDEYYPPYPRRKPDCQICFCYPCICTKKEKTIMTKAEFKKRWESDANGGGITYDDIADCAKAWGISSHPKTSRIDRITEQVLKAVGCVDAEEFNPARNPEYEAQWELALNENDYEAMLRFIKDNGLDGESFRGLLNEWMAEQ